MTIEELLDRCKDAYERNDFTKALGICDEILKKDSANQVAVGYKARCLYLLGENEEALKILDDAIISYPKNYRYLDIKAEVLMDKGEYEGPSNALTRYFPSEWLMRRSLTSSGWIMKPASHLRWTS